MAINRVLLMLVVVAVCVGLSVAGPLKKRGRGLKAGGQHKPEKLEKFVCKVENSTDILANKTCGCGDEAELGVECSLGPIEVTKGNETFKVTFCDVSPDWTAPNPWRGVLGASACSIDVDGTTVEPRSCGPDVECSVGPLSFTVNETVSVTAFFCERPEDEDSDEIDRPGKRPHGSESSNSDSSSSEEEASVSVSVDDDDDCVPLSRKSRRGGNPNPAEQRQNRRRGNRGKPDSSEESEEDPAAQVVEGLENEEEEDSSSGSDESRNNGRGPSGGRGRGGAEQNGRGRRPEP